MVQPWAHRFYAVFSVAIVTYMESHNVIRNGPLGDRKLRRDVSLQKWLLLAADKKATDNDNKAAGTKPRFQALSRESAAAWNLGYLR